MSIATAKVNLDSLPAKERDAIIAAEAEAEEFYGDIEKEETERERLAELWKICSLMHANRYNGYVTAADYLQGKDIFTSSERVAIMHVGLRLHPGTEAAAAIKALEFTTAVARLYKTMQTGYYFENMPATELLLKYAKNVKF